jgi:hypothetical protein
MVHELKDGDRIAPPPGTLRFESAHPFEETMQLPNVDNFIKDSQQGVTYNICAYRKLSQDEMMRAMRIFIQQQEGRRPARGAVVKIFSLAGLDDA